MTLRSLELILQWGALPKPSRTGRTGRKENAWYRNDQYCDPAEVAAQEFLENAGRQG